MDKKITEEKLHKNTRRVTGIAALRKIRILVDNIETQDNRSKKCSIVSLVITLIMFSCFIYYILSHDWNLINIKTSQADAVVVYGE